MLVMDFIPVPELDVCVDGATLFPANMIVPSNGIEKRLLRQLIGRLVKDSSYVSWGRRGDRRRDLVSNGYRFSGLGTVEWGEAEGDWNGWCFSTLTRLRLLMAVRLVDVKDRIGTQYALVDPKHLTCQYKCRWVDSMTDPYEFDVPEEIMARVA